MASQTPEVLLTLQFRGSRAFDETCACDVRINDRRRDTHRIPAWVHDQAESGFEGCFDLDFKVTTGAHPIAFIVERNYDSQERHMTLSIHKPGHVIVELEFSGSYTGGHWSIRHVSPDGAASLS